MGSSPVCKGTHDMERERWQCRKVWVRVLCKAWVYKVEVDIDMALVWSGNKVWVLGMVLDCKV